MSVLTEVTTIVSDLAKRMQGRKLSSVVWVAAGGSNGGFYPAHYFMEHESKTIRSAQYTSKEFVLAPPAYVGASTLVVLCSMRGTPETIDAARVAHELGASTVGLYVQKSALLDHCDFAIKYDSIALDESRTERVNSSIGLNLAINLVQQFEGYAHFDLTQEAFAKVDALYREAFEANQEPAAAWAKSVADKSCIYVMGSGPAWGSAYIFSICNIEEMLQIDSPTTNCCEFFHGPFETIKQDTPVFLLMSAGRSRAADERARTFLQKYNSEGLFVLDGMELGLQKIAEPVREYFNHVLFSPVLNNVYMRALAAEIGKDYNTRTYMWQVAY